MKAKTFQSIIDSLAEVRKVVQSIIKVWNDNDCLKTIDTLLQNCTNWAHCVGYSQEKEEEKVIDIKKAIKAFSIYYKDTYPFITWVSDNVESIIDGHIMSEDFEE